MLNLMFAQLWKEEPTLGHLCIMAWAGDRFEIVSTFDRLEIHVYLQFLRATISRSRKRSFSDSPGHRPVNLFLKQWPPNTGSMNTLITSSDVNHESVDSFFRFQSIMISLFFNSQPTKIKL